MKKSKELVLFGLIALIVLFVGTAINYNSYAVSATKATTKATAKMKEKQIKAIICIDPGHQLKGMRELEPIGPGSEIKKASVSSGTRGVATKKTEYQLNLEISMKLKKYLGSLGYKVVMTREKNEVTLSNIARAKIANDSGAVLFVRIHADGSPSDTTTGYSVLYPSEKDIFTKKIWEQSKRAAQLVEKSIKRETMSKSRGIVPREDLTGLNWTSMPAILVEVGFMSNPAEDRKLSEVVYQEKMALGIAKGIDTYITNDTLK